MDIKDYYEILGCTPNATPEELKRAYRELAAKLHPDLASPQLKAWAERQMKLLNEAYGVLGDRRKREQYDQARHYHAFAGSARPRQAAASPPSLLSIPLVRTIAVTIGFMVGFAVLSSLLRMLMWNPKGMIEVVVILGVAGGIWWMRRGNTRGSGKEGKRGKG